jgi:diguanylate cyclase (GGDEF)-like protein
MIRRTILLVEDNPGDAALVREALRDGASSPNAAVGFHLEWTECLGPALDRIAAGGIDIVMLDLSLPDSDGIETLRRLREQAPTVPVILLTGLDDEAVEEMALQAGAQDYLTKIDITGRSIRRAIRYAIERHQAQAELLRLSIIDPLTGLYNRRGFAMLAERYLNATRREPTDYVVVFVDIDGLKRINDTLGHAQGDAAIVEAADVLKETFRASDIVARLGGDEFAVLVTDVRPEVADIITTRLEGKQNQRNTRAGRLFTLSMSFGVAVPDRPAKQSIDELVAAADRQAYQRKQSRGVMRP